MRDTKTVIALIVVSLTLVAALGLAVAGCGTGVAAKTGTIEVRVTDAPGDVQEILVEVLSVEVHRAGAEGEEGVWIPLAIVTEDNPFDLIALEGLQLTLAGEDEVAAGTYTQLRVIIGTVTVVLEGEVGQPSITVEATIPSGELKFVRPFEVAEGGITVIVLDFDATESLVFTGNDKIIFKPVVKLSIEPEE